MRRLLLGLGAATGLVAAHPAMAADLPQPAPVYKAPVAAPPSVYDWTGFYVGGHIGGGWSNTDWLEDGSNTAVATPTPAGFPDGTVNASGLLGGVQAGYNYQTGWAVWGVEAAISGSHITGNTGFGNCFPEDLPTSVNACGGNINALATVTGRVGAAYNSMLFYVLGGAAWEHETLSNPCSNCLPEPLSTHQELHRLSRMPC